VSLLEITEVSQAPPAEALLGSYLDRPLPGSSFDRTAFEISGWLVGRHSRAFEVRVVAEKTLIRTIPMAVPRPDVTALHPNAPELSGFWSLAGTVGLDPDFTLEIRGVPEDGTSLDIGSIRGKRAAIASSVEPRLRPLLVTSLGRTGTTLLMNLLSAHPAVVAHRAYPYEIFPARYWLHLLRVLAEPADFVDSSHPTTFTEDLWKIGHNPFHTAPVTEDPELADLLGRSYVERLAGFCQQSIDEFYEAVASSQGKSSVEFFAEKFQPDHLPRMAWELYPEAREIVLVRDFRDLICSVFAFNEKRGTVEFGRNGFTTDEEYVRYVGRRARQLVDAWKSRSEVSKLVRYEDLATRSAEVVDGLLAYLGLDREPAVIEAMVRTAFEHPDVADHRTTPTVVESIGRWQQDLSPSLLAVVSETLDGTLAELGYELG